MVTLIRQSRKRSDDQSSIPIKGSEFSLRHRLQIEPGPTQLIKWVPGFPTTWNIIQDMKFFFQPKTGLKQANL
ncbi:hypothetical protein L798_08148 [Zootermopsis nevadensis]|uniref:Uncharacterized protein n=1 Tax=Zootermopsis nevadensis TaxID=136037 RepID=A0A067RCY2_ZOONE|nr:hypothetical protein L798_08148 [Zootermopsis nevadensis]